MAENSRTLEWRDHQHARNQLGHSARRSAPILVDGTRCTEPESDLEPCFLPEKNGGRGKD